MNTVFHSRRRACRERRAALSVIELLAVVAVLVVLALLTIPAVGNMQRSFQLAKAAAMVREHLELARQLAVTRNQTIVASLCKTTDSAGNEAFNVLSLARRDDAGNLVPIERAIRFPVGFGVSEEAAWSTIMGRPAAQVPVDGTNRDARQIAFSAGGGADLPLNQAWFLTVHSVSTENAPSDNFVTLVVEPATGRTFSYQP